MGEVIEKTILEITPLRFAIELAIPYFRMFYSILLDMGANHNLLSFATWNQLGKPHLVESELKVKVDKSKNIKVLGVLNIVTYYDKEHLVGSLLLMPAT